MKYISKISALFLILFFLISSCDKITFPYTEGGNSGNTVDTIRKVLLEDFTGHRCTNCPQSHKVAADLQDYYGKQLIVVAIHATTLAKPKPPTFVNDFRTAEGTELSNFFQVPFVPIGMVNRVKQSNGGYLVDKGAFATEVSKQIDSLPQEPDIFIQLDPTFNTGDSTINLQTDVTFLNSSLTTGKYNLCVMITESDIISPQSNNDPSLGTTPEILDYSHQHMLRGMLTTTWGDEVLDGAPSNNLVVHKNYSGFKLGNDWVPKNCHIVAFVYHADGSNEYQIVQAEEVKLVP